MDKQIFRAPSQILWFGAIFVITPILMGIAVSLQFHTQGIKVNGVVSYDPKTLLLSLLFLSLFVLVGLGIMAMVLFIRVETDSEGVKLFNAFNRPTFAAAWSEVIRYERVDGMLGTRSSRYWKISTDKNSAKIPRNFDTYPAMQSALLARIPEIAIPKASKVENSGVPSTVADLDLPMRGQGINYAMLFSIAWYGFLAAFLGIALFGTPTQDSGSSGVTGKLLFLVTPLLFAIAPYPLFSAAWKARLRGSIKANRSAIAAYDGVSSHEVAWNDLKMLEIRWIQSNNRSYIEQMVLVGATDAIALKGDLSAYSQLKQFAIAHAPAGCLALL